MTAHQRPAFSENYAKLQAAQKSSKGAPLYSLLVNRPLGRVFAALQGIVGAGMLVATGLGGVLLGVLGTREVVTGCGVLAAVLLVAVYTGLLRAVRRTPSAVDPVSGELVTSSATGGEPS